MSWTSILYNFDNVVILKQNHSWIAQQNNINRERVLNKKDVDCENEVSHGIKNHGNRSADTSSCQTSKWHTFMCLKQTL